MKSIAVLVPCYNEAPTIKGVIDSFRAVLPHAEIYVYDNYSDDNTADIAREAGVHVRKVRARGKGNVVRRMFSDIDADLYIMVDGDATYTAEDAPLLIKELQERQADMVIAKRRAESDGSYPSGHALGNRLFNCLLKILFNSYLEDIFSGYRVFTKRFVKTFPVMSNGFDIEAELTIHALTLSIPCSEVSSKYLERPPNSFSKLCTFKDGFRILWSIVLLLKETRPLFFFGIIALILFCLSCGLAAPVIYTFLQTGLVPRIPTAILSVGVMLVAMLSFVCGLILDSISQGRMEIKKLHYLSFDGK